MAVVVQQMVAATASGVAFGINPLNGNKAEKIINAIQGLGENLVSGQQNADAYRVSNNIITERKLIDVTPVLSDDQILIIADQLTKVENFFGQPQDIEFAFEKDTFYLLQSRPVTTTVSTEKTIVWDNSNIVESYPGLTLPLTFSFIEKMYEAVYRQFSLVMGVGKKVVEKNNNVYANMLGLLNGRVYYNLNSWYASLAQLPGYSVNAEFMEKMMGVREKPPIESTKKSRAGIGDYWQIVSAVAGIIKNLATARKMKKKFINDFDDVYNRFSQKDYASVSLQEIITDYQTFEKLMVSRWKAPLVNDLFAMIYFGLLQKQCTKYAPDFPNLSNQLIASSKDIITTEPLRLLPALASKIAANEKLREIFIEKNNEEIWQYLQLSAFTKERKLIQEYINVWGERCVAELKLETITYRQQPERLIALLQSYIQSNIFSYIENENTAIERRDAENIIQQRLKGKWVKQKLFRHVLKQARYFVSNRENLRYYRTKGFGMVRQMMSAAGTILQKENNIDHERDIFYLQLPELLQLDNNSTIVDSLKSKISKRKKDYQLFETMPLPERIITNGKPPEYIIQPLQNTIQQGDTTELKGIPCSAGVVRSTIRIVREASALTSLNGSILATYATDPGWVVLFPSAAGIITERGSLLSHAAIVSREMGIPCIVGVNGLMDSVKDGAEIIMDGSTGIIRIINDNEV
jgi:rifampicin phosphotransferase